MMVARNPGNVIRDYAPKQIPIDFVFPDPMQPRQHYDRARLARLGDNMALVGQYKAILAEKMDYDALKAYLRTCLHPRPEAGC